MTKWKRGIKVTGVYLIKNKLTGKVYVGSSSSSIKERWRTHARDLRKCKHHSSHLQYAWNKYGEDSFEWKVLEECNPEKCLEREQYYINHYNSSNKEFGYNLLPFAGSSFGSKTSDETKSKISAAKTGHKFSEEHKRKISEALKGRIFSQESRIKLSESAKNRVMSDEARLKIKNSWKQRRLIPVSQETRRKLSEASKGRIRPIGAIILTASKVRGQKRSDEQRKRMSEAQLKWRRERAASK